MTESYRLYGVEFSYYSGKVRAYLRKKGIPFEEIASTLSVYRRFIVPRTGVRFIPVVQTPDDQVFQDTTVIIDELEQRFPERPVYPQTPKQRLVSLLLELYGDEWLLLPAMHYRWHYMQQNARFIYGEFGSIVWPGALGFVQRWLGKKVGGRFKGFVSRLGITDHNYQAIETSYEQFLNDLNRHLQEHDYLLGSRPCIADFGLIGPLYAHLYRDPAPGELMRSKAPAVARWVERMIDEQAALQQGELLPDDQIPETLMPILQRMAREQLPVLLDTDIRLSQWKDDHPDAGEVPRFIGRHSFTVEGVTEERVVLPYSIWMFQRPVDFYHAQSDEVRGELDRMLAKAGFGDSLQQGLRNRLIRPDNKLRFA